MARGINIEITVKNIIDMMGLSKKFVTSRPALVFSPVSWKRYENTAIRKVSEQVF